MLRHEGLKQQPPDSIALIERAIGGHPRTLEYLDALLRNGNARLDAVRERLIESASRAGVSLSSSGGLEEHVQDAIRVAAADALVEELLLVVGQNQSDLDVLWQASVFPFPVPRAALAFDKQFPEAPIEAASLSSAIERLAASSLLTTVDDDRVFVHRWTAESLKPHMSRDAYRTSCIRAGEYLQQTPIADVRQWRTDRTESMRLFLAVQEFDSAAALAWHLIGVLQPYAQTTMWTELAREMGTALPEAHLDKVGFIVTEGDGLTALGFTARALELYTTAQRSAERTDREWFSRPCQPAISGP